MKNYNDTIENRTRDLPACSAVRQLTAPPRAPMKPVLPVIQGGIFFHSFTTLVGLGLLTVDASQTHSDTYSVELLWKRDRPFQRLLLYNTQDKRQTFMPPGEIRTHNPSKRESAHRHLRPRGHWDLPKEELVHDNICVRYLQIRHMHVGYK